MMSAPEGCLHHTASPTPGPGWQHGQAAGDGARLEASPPACCPAGVQPLPLLSPVLPMASPAAKSPLAQSGQPPLAASSGQAGPITPDPAPTQASATPAASQQAAHAASAASAVPATAPRHPPAAATAAPVEQPAGQLWPRVHSFVRCVVESPLVQSALCSLLVRDEGGDGDDGPPPFWEALAPGQCLQFALAQMLALHLRAGYETASEEGVLAALWTLQSYDSCWASPASVRLSAYIKHLARFAPELVPRLTADWPACFHHMRKALVAAQRELLARVDWRLRLDLHTDVRPCHLWLFQSPEAWRLLAARVAPEPLPPGAAPAQAPPPVAWGVWAAHMRRLCKAVDRQAAAAAGPAPLVPDCTDAAAAPHPHAGPAAPAPSIKRQRIKL